MPQMHPDHAFLPITGHKGIISCQLIIYRLRFTRIWLLKGLTNPNVAAGPVSMAFAHVWRLEEDEMSSKPGGFVVANLWQFSDDIPNALIGMLTESQVAGNSR